MSTCRTCGAEIAFLKMMGGKTMPVDLPPEKRIVISHAGSQEYVVLDTYVSHFASCPDADKWRRDA